MLAIVAPVLDQPGVRPLLWMAARFAPARKGGGETTALKTSMSVLKVGLKCCLKCHIFIFFV